MKKKYLGFTLAEVLITVMIIGVVAVFTMPTMRYIMQNKVRERQVEVAQQKFYRAAELMTIEGKMGPYYTDTLDFVNQLSKHLKIVKTCRVGDTPASLPPVNDCFGDDYDTITLNSKGDTYKISDIQTGAQFQLAEDDTNDWTSDNIAFMTIDGTRYLVSYNKKCISVEPGVYVGSTAYSCLSGLYDVDGDKKPNTIGKDVYLFGSAKSIGSSCVYGFNQGVCFSAPIHIRDIGKATYSECLDIEEKYNVSEDICGAENSENIWYANLVKICGGQNKIAGAAEIAKVASYIYDTTISASSLNKLYTTIATTSLSSEEVSARAQEYGLNTWTYIINGGLVTEDSSLGTPLLNLKTGAAYVWQALSTRNVYGADSMNIYAFCKL